MATIEVKSRLTKDELLKAETAAKKLKEEVCDPEGSIYKNQEISLLYAVIGFYGTGTKHLKDDQKGKTWLKDNIQHLFAICLTNKYSWLNNVGGIDRGWTKKGYDPETNEETKRFIAVILDNVRTRSESRIKLLGSHNDWLGIYMRDQENIKQYFRNQGRL